MSVYSSGSDGRYGLITIKGRIEFALQYNYKQGSLEIYVAQCKDLAAADIKRNRSDPYVKVCESLLTPLECVHLILNTYIFNAYLLSF